MLKLAGGLGSAAHTYLQDLQVLYRPEKKQDVNILAGSGNVVAPV